VTVPKRSISSAPSDRTWSCSTSCCHGSRVSTCAGPFAPGPPDAGHHGHGKTSEIDTVVGLEVGADDYVTSLTA